MLKINKFYWTLYKESPEGKKTIEKFENASKKDFSIENSLALLKEYDPDWFLNVDEGDIRSRFKLLASCKTILPLDNIQLEREQAIEFIDEEFGGDYEEALGFIIPISFYLYKQDPSYFFPYMFLLRYKYIRQILEDYDLDIMEVPGKAEYDERCIFYLDICDALYKFRRLNDLTGPELCAFLYDMERKRFDAENEHTENFFPQVWLISGTKKNAKEANGELLFWHANAETKKGDILVFYENRGTYYPENNSSISGIWIAQTDGISDPFFYFYGSVLIGNEIKIKPIPFKVLRDDPRTKTLPRMGANFLGVRGDAVTYKTYEGLLELIEERDPSFDRSRLPLIHKSHDSRVPYDEVRNKMKPEKWVEEYFIRDLLEKQMGLKYKVDYDRQVHLQLGRAKIEGEKTQDGRTDFSLFPFGRKLKSADVLIEAKGPGEMEGKKVEIAFWQAESYASRQYAGLIILADNKDLLLFPRGKDGTFKFSNTPQKYSWDEIFGNMDKFNELRNIIMKYRIHSK